MSDFKRCPNCKNICFIELNELKYSILTKDGREKECCKYCYQQTFDDEYSNEDAKTQRGE